ncbi:MAG: hypothetical protein IKZ12_01100 [Alistipes sp.]|nr:hypothetical protein [Alistipes sp.]
MTGMRKRITVSFLSIACLLFISGMLSFVELNRLSRGTGDILAASRRNIELAKEMLDAAHELNVALIHRSVLSDRGYDSLCRAAMARLENVHLTARHEALDRSFLDSLSFATTEMKVLVDGYLTRSARRAEQEAAAAILADTLPHDDSLWIAQVEPMLHPEEHARPDGWYTEEFEASYNRLTAAVKAYMTSTQSSLAPRTEQMKKNAYRAVTPVLISLAVMIAIVLMFYYFMTIYCVNPVLGINKSLGNYLAFKVPFVVKEECKDELLELKEKIEQLINQARQAKS